MIERNIDCRKHRKSTHLASADIEAMILEKKDPIFIIEDVRYETGVKVNGRDTDAYFCKFKGVKKEWVVNSGNRDIITGFANSYNIGDWSGLKIELYVDSSVEMKGEVVGGIRVCPIQPKEAKKPSFTKDNFDAAKKAGADLKKVKEIYEIDAKTEKEYLEFIK